MECDFCGEEFEDERELHLHWGEEHEEGLTSHQQEKVKKAERKTEEEEQVRRKKRRRTAGWAFTALIAVSFVALVGPQLLGSMLQSRQSFDLSEEPMLGSQDANVTVVAFEDFKCPYCAQFTAGPYQQLKTEYIQTGKVKFYFVNNPLPLGQDSYTAAAAGECVLEQDE